MYVTFSDVSDDECARNARELMARLARTLRVGVLPSDARHKRHYLAHGEDELL